VSPPGGVGVVPEGWWLSDGWQPVPVTEGGSVPAVGGGRAKTIDQGSDGHPQFASQFQVTQSYVLVPPADSG
jgi:hypothetical protein